ncbi:hypothetical protein C0J52_27519 [Blattella germanica]|nr:hypothetical protein C0J52_27519 [Blattella germanica]
MASSFFFTILTFIVLLNQNIVCSFCLKVERKVDEADKLYQTMPTALPSISSQSSIDQSEGPSHVLSTQSSLEGTDSVLSDESDDPKSNGCSPDSCLKDSNNKSCDQDCQHWEKHLNRSMSGPDCLEKNRDKSIVDDVKDKIIDSEGSDEYEEQFERSLSAIEDAINVEGVVRRAAKTGSAAIRRRPGKRRSRTKLKRRCSINGHFYNRETSFFTPPHGSQMSVWVTSLVNTQEVINLLLEKYKVDSKPVNFALFIVRDNGEQRRLRDDEYPLLVRVMLGPHEDVAKLFLMDRQNTQEISNEVAQFLNLSVAECRAILERYQEEEEREAKRVRTKFREMRKRIKQRMEDLKVRL